MFETVENQPFALRVPAVDIAREDPLAFVERDHAVQRGLADLLEALADSLPDAARPARAALCASMLRAYAERSAAVDGRGLFDALERRLGGDDATRAAIALARREHAHAGGQAIELAEELDSLGRTGRAREAECLGFMLRAFFDGLRRRLDWIDAAILVRARQSLSKDDLAALGTRIESLLGDCSLAPRGLVVIEGDRR